MRGAGRSARPVLADALVLAILLLGGLLLRLPGLELGLWRDEASSYLNALPDTLDGVLARVAANELNPPGFFLALHAWMGAVGADEAAIKVPALLSGLLLVPAVYALGHAVQGRWAGLVGAALAAVSPPLVYYSQELRPYTLAALLATLTVLAYVKALGKRHRRAYLAAFTLGAASLLYVQYTGLVLLGALALVTAALATRRLVPWRPHLVAFAAVGVLFLPWLAVFLSHLAAENPWVSKRRWLERPELFLDNVAYALPLRGGWAEAAALVVAALLGVVTLRLLVFPPRDPPVPSPGPAGLLVLGASFALPAALLAGLSYSGRYMVPFVPLGLTLLAAWSRRLGVCLGAGRWPCALAVLLLALDLVVLPAVGASAGMGRDAKSGVRELARDVTADAGPETAFLISPDRLAPTFAYYARGLPVVFFGFGRWERPDLFSPQGYAALWSDPDLLDRTLGRVVALPAAGHTRLGLVHDDRIDDAGPLRRGTLATRLLRELERRYHLLSHASYSGRKESATLYLFDLTAPADGTPPG
jgi:hypothetical protein